MSAGIRRRNVPSTQASDDFTAARALESLKSFDVYTKVQDDFVQKSQAGGVVTVITAFIIAILFWTEVCTFCTVEVAHSVSVDTRLNQKLPIGLNITFPHLRCDEVSVDTVDSAGDNQVDVHGGLAKINLDALGRTVKEESSAKKGECHSCMDAADDKHKCCNTCHELKEAYQDKDLPYIEVLDHAEQCKGSVGCQVVGNVIVNKVSGNVHVALGRSAVHEGKLVHEFNMNDVSGGFNTSHQIHSISFGEHVPGVTSPLEGTRKVVRHGAFMFHYYLKLVPTVFITRYKEEIYTNQYSVTDSARNVQVRSGELSGLPGVFIVYDFSPFLMKKTEKPKPWSYILKSICALIGGVFSIATLVEMVVNSFVGKMFGCQGGVLSKV